jgi:hypothetical protein
MNSVESSLRDISEIRSMMERSSKFLSLSGLSGVSAGVVALVGAALLWGQSTNALSFHRPDLPPTGLVPLVEPAWTNVGFTVMVSLTVLVVAVGLAMALSMRMARRKGLAVWTNTTRHLLIDLGLPLAAGGAFTGILITKGLLLLAPSSTLVFYGLALLNASRYTVSEIRLVALSEVLLGIAAALWIWYGLLFWAVGFGLLHILYGVVIYWKYER